jgi:hypothetical protein
MQLKQVLLAGCLSILVFASCSKKDSAPLPAASPEGNWAGKYSVLSGPYNGYYSFKIKAGGVLELQDSLQQKAGTGTWELENKIFTGTYSFLAPATGTFSVIANFNNNTGKLDGTWGTGLQEYGGGYWYMYKTN